jgi:ParB-like chromosome segregation protein Spo0J
MTTAKTLKRAFEKGVIVVPLAAILPSRTLNESVKKSIKYRRIARSVAEIGLVEPLVVSRSGGVKGKLLLLDGHARLAALLASGATETRCLVALDDEAFTYNKRVSHLATIQEHYMIMKALAKGASEQKIANTLDLDVAAIRLRKTLLDGICPEVVDLFKSRSVNIGVFSPLRRMKPLRQIESAELMIAAGNLSASYAKVLLAGTRDADLVNAERKKAGGLTAEQMDRMQREMEAVQADFKGVEKKYGDNVLQLVVANGYVGALIRNVEIERYLGERYPEILTQFRSIVRATSLDQAQPS